ncbi:hypothetical protein HPB47_004464 [Ixodes persulcatus]|uniref:Uncharacterized protein n=1 Tax=Ixodes persulcatus TaxID=34615 RepID=A0AC60PFV1_IXOPE|nr:hypothetical protein HPB47_004464 [Ixodes persulcatus]
MAADVETLARRGNGIGSHTSGRRSSSPSVFLEATAEVATTLSVSSGSFNVLLPHSGVQMVNERRSRECGYLMEEPITADHPPDTWKNSPAAQFWLFSKQLPTAVCRVCSSLVLQVVMSAPSGFRRSFPATFKRTVIVYAEETNNCAAGHKFDVSERVVCQWRLQRSKIFSCDGKRRGFRGPKSGRFPELEDKLAVYVSEVCDRSLPVTCDMVTERARIIALEAGIPRTQFKASRSWASKFMKRAGFSLRRRTSVCQKLPAAYEEKCGISLNDDVHRDRSSDNEDDDTTSEYQRRTARLYATNYLRVLLRLELLDFRKWAMELLVTQLYDKSRAVSLAASDILDEACDLRENLEALIALRPALLCLGDRGLLLQIRFLSLPSGFKYLLEANVLESELRKWDEVNHLRYVKIVEDVINQAVTWHQRGEDGTYGRRSSNTRQVQRLKVQDVFAPVHLYGQLVQHLQGLSYLQQHGSLRQHWETVLLGDMSSLESLLRLKASLWTVGHVGTSPEGFALVSEADVLPAIVKMAQDAPVYSIRGTCFYVLCLLATTTEAVEALASLGWESVQHRHHEAWPIAADALAGLAAPSPTNSPRGRPHAWSVSSTGSQWSELLSASALHRRFRGTSTASSFEGVESPLADTPSRRTLNFVTQQSREVGAGPNIRQAQTLPRNATLSPRVDAVVASSRRPRSSSDCRPGEPTTHDSAAPAPTERSRLLAIPCTAKDRSGSFGGSRDSGTESTSLGEKSASALEVCSAAVLSDAKGAASVTTGPKGERSDSNESSQTTGTGKSRSDSCTDSTTSGVSSCDEAGPRAVQTLSPIASSTSLSTLGGHRSESAPRRPRGFPGGSGSLSRGSMSASPTSPDLPVTMYTSARDAAGYATLRALREASSLRRRRRVCSLGCDGGEEDALLVTLAGRSLERSGFYIGEEPSPEDRAGSRTASVASDISHLTARPEMRDAEEKFMGLCLPVDTSLIFTVREEEGSCEECERPPTIPEVAEDRNDGFELHTVENCLQCHSVARVAELRLSRTNGGGHPAGVTKVEGFQYLGSTADQKTDANYVTYSSQARKNRRPSENDYDVVAVRKELLRYIANLNSSVILKGSEQGLLSLKQKYPKAFQDVCLYSEVCLLMARYRFRLSARTFLQELFLDIGFEKQFLEEAEDILRIPHIVIMPPAEESEA